MENQSKHVPSCLYPVVKVISRKTAQQRDNVPGTPEEHMPIRRPLAALIENHRNTHPEDQKPHGPDPTQTTAEGHSKKYKRPHGSSEENAPPNPERAMCENTNIHSSKGAVLGSVNKKHKTDYSHTLEKPEEVLPMCLKDHDYFSSEKKRHSYVC
ncbi:hypothetical protein Y1Q_0020886 [Alligator mississippiensis]|uniref:Uncharacterized protein n=1 Tax=Alligator mississippiensis TaxID=8496 RepID=A0A151NJJ6_ALLMI|nr:hypothetical protein Y1Q_0020886 [Alligator mississippiensis]